MLRKILMLGLMVGIIFLSGCTKYNSSIHECNEWKCQRCTPSLFGVSCEPTKKDVEVCGGYEVTNQGKWRAVCVDYEEMYNAIDAGSQMEVFTISAKKIKVGDVGHENKWPE